MASDGRKDWLVPQSDFEAGIEKTGLPSHFALSYGTMRTGFYKPRGADGQQPHTQDELYIVQSGNGRFFKDGERRRFGPGDVIFVEAGAEHRFEEFSDDFAAWVVFWGPDGGEQDGDQ